MRECGRILARTFLLIEDHIKPGITTAQIDRLAAQFILSQGGRPAFKGILGPKRVPYPANICISIDEEVVHGIPGNRTLREGQIVSIDIGVEKGGYFGDAAFTYAVGKVDSEKSRLLEATRKALGAGIARVRAGGYLGDISHAVESVVTETGFSVVRDLVGHGIGSRLHEEPQIPNFGPAGRGPRLFSGMTLAIEPMVNMGDWPVKTLGDSWTVITADGLPSAHFEHTVVVTEGEPEVLTKLT